MFGVHSAELCISDQELSSTRRHGGPSSDVFTARSVLCTVSVIQLGWVGHGRLWYGGSGAGPDVGGAMRSPAGGEGVSSTSCNLFFVRAASHP